MTEGQIAICVSVLGLAGHFVNGWLNAKMRVDVLEMEQRVGDRIDGKYVPRKEFDIEVQRLEERCDARLHVR